MTSWQVELWSLKHLSFDTFHTSAGSGDLDFKSGAKRTHFEPECCCWIDGKLESVASLEQLTVDMWQDLTLDKQYAPHKSNSQIHNASNQGRFFSKTNFNQIAQLLIPSMIVSDQPCWFHKSTSLCKYMITWCNCTENFCI